MTDHRIFVLFMLAFSLSSATLAALMVYRVLQAATVLP